MNSILHAFKEAEIVTVTTIITMMMMMTVPRELTSEEKRKGKTFYIRIKT